MNQFPPSPRVFHLDRFEFFGKFTEIFASQGAPPFSLALLIPVANLPPVSTTSVANCHRYQRRRRQICHRCQRHRWQIMATISGCRHLKVNLKAKTYIYVNSTTQRCPNKIIKIFLLEGFFHLPFANLELRISPRIFEKIQNGPNGIRGLGETNSRKIS
jgi:hypothetical protein